MKPMSSDDEEWLAGIQARYQPVGQLDDAFNQQVRGRIIERRRRRVLLVSAGALMIFASALMFTGGGEAPLGTPKDPSVKSQLTVQDGAHMDDFFNAYSQVLVPGQEDEGQVLMLGEPDLVDLELDTLFLGVTNQIDTDDWLDDHDALGGDIQAVAQLISLINTEETL